MKLLTKNEPDTTSARKHAPGSRFGLRFTFDCIIFKSQLFLNVHSTLGSGHRFLCVDKLAAYVTFFCI